ncbi:tyrosine-type recombinase/integrase [Leeuwenhoekiella sp. NPDC079379]|uniref:tyrosine-type recombinase/integrase n=1 Tax=Leeuwenhoekiella sp. NPDC079379 TaxID=3364122 RepID=UPI0037C56669
MATTKFILQGKSNPTPIYLRLSLGRNNTPKRKTGLFCNPNDWSTTTGLPKQNKATNKALASQLKNLENHILDRYNFEYPQGVQITGEWLENEIDSFFKQGIKKNDLNKLTDYIDHYLSSAHLRKNAKGGVGLGKSSIKNYNRLKGLIQEFESKTPVLIRDVNFKFKDAFLKWMTDTKGYALSYAGRKLGSIKTICIDAKINGIETHRQLDKISGFKVKNENIIYLNPDELQQIENATLEHPYLENARKWLLLGCSIGQRGNDMLSLTENNIVLRNGLKLIELTQEKTGKNVAIPVLPTTEKIIKDGLPYKISLQKLNDYIKEVCEIAGLTDLVKGQKVEVIEKGKGNKQKRIKKGLYPKHELITSHICRRSFATNLYGNMPTPLIMQITAHSTEKTFYGYIGKNSLDYAQQIAEYYAKQTARESKEPQMQVIKNASNL